MTKTNSEGRALQVPLSSLLLDDRNPRLPPDKKGGDQQTLADHIESAFNPHVVAESIATHGFFFSEPLIVVQSEEQKDKWVVIEGNRRLVALLGLVDPEIRRNWVNPAWWEDKATRAGLSIDSVVPVVAMDDRSATTPIVGFRHISGIREWEPLAQARFIAGLVDGDQKTFAEVSEMVGIDKSKVASLYRDQAIATEVADTGAETGRLEDAFSLLQVAMSSTSLRDHIGAPSGVANIRAGETMVPSERRKNLRELITWLYGEGLTPPKINDSRQISKLGKAVASPIGLASLRSGETIESALQKVDDANDDPKKRVLNQLKTARRALTAVQDELGDLATDTEVQEAVGSALDAAEDLRAMLEALVERAHEE